MTIQGRALFAPGDGFQERGEKRPRPGPWDDFWYSKQPYENSIGIDVTEDLSLTYSTVWACVKVISEDLASLPLFVYKRGDNSKEKAPDHPLYWLLHDQPNPEMTAMQFREALQAHLLLFGNAYAQILLDLRGRPQSIWPLDPKRMTVTRPGKEIVYEYRLPDGTKELFPRDEIFHIAGLGYNGLIGHSPIAYHREAIGVGLSAQQFQGSILKNGAFPSVALTHPSPKAPSKAGRDEFRAELAQEYSGRSNTGKIMTLWEGMKAERLSMTMEDSQFIESRKYNRTEICAIYRVPPHKIMDLERATFSNIEQQSISYVIDAIRPWAVRWEQAINQRLLRGSGMFFAEHSMEGLLRGDIASRYAAYAVGRQWGWLTVNRILELENLNPVKGGDTRLEPLNMVSIDENGERIIQSAPEPAAPEAPITDQEKEAAARAIRQLRLIRR
jgi:HK97 family phage portal protein